ncbi:ubiquinol-cytochrome C reductase complex subunit [Ceratobasidium sp. AG-Ba]|nr:ubiquinol-cytochrome C reductase complex subunit [Ceratobasidium sp. AG-Ba]
MTRIHIQSQTRLGPFTFAGARPWIRTAGVWGAGAGAAVALLMSVTPIFKKDVLLKVPVVSQLPLDDFWDLLLTGSKPNLYSALLYSVGNTTTAF